LSLLLEISSILLFTRLVPVFNKYYEAKLVEQFVESMARRIYPESEGLLITVFLFCRHCGGRRGRVMWPSWRMAQESLFNGACS